MRWMMWRAISARPEVQEREREAALERAAAAGRQDELRRKHYDEEQQLARQQRARAAKAARAAEDDLRRTHALGGDKLYGFIATPSTVFRVLNPCSLSVLCFKPLLLEFNDTI